MMVRHLCHHCGHAIPVHNIDGSPARAGHEFWNEGDLYWHYNHPLFDNCLALEAAAEGNTEITDLLGYPLKYTSVESAEIEDLELYFPEQMQRFLSRKGVL